MANRAQVAPKAQPDTPAHAWSGPAPVDRAHLGRYTLADPRLEREILGLFVAQLPLTIEAMRFAATDKDWRTAAHTLKGSARAVGASTVADLALTAEKLGGLANAEACRAIIARIEEAVAEVEAYVAAVFPDPKG